MEMMNLLNVFSEKQKRKVTPDEALAVFNHMAAQGQKPTRAQLRINAMRSITVTVLPIRFFFLPTHNIMSPLSRS
jgi:hypothetical protein